MAKPKRVRETSHPLGMKINFVLAEKGIPGDYNAIAKEFEVALPSVYGWVEKGRISKDRLPKLAAWSGRGLEWWLDVEAEPADHEDQKQQENDRLMALLSGWRMKASPRSREVIDQLAVLAQKNALREDDWTLIETLANRLRQTSPTP